MRIPGTVRSFILLVMASPALGLSYDDYTTWTYGIQLVWDAAISGDLLLTTNHESSQEILSSYRIGEEDRLVTLCERQVIGYGDMGQIAVQGDFAWTVMRDSWDFQLLGFDVSDPTDLQILSTTELPSWGVPLDLLVVPGWLIVVYESDFSAFPILPGGALGDRIHHNQDHADHMGTDGELLLMPTPTGGSACRVLEDGSLETVCGFPPGLDIVRAARADSEYAFSTTDTTGPGIFVYDSTCTTQLAHLPVATLARELGAQDGVIVAGTDTELSMFWYGQGSLSPRGSSCITPYLHQIRWLQDERLFCLWDVDNAHRLTLVDLRQVRWMPVEPQVVTRTRLDTRMLSLGQDGLVFGDASGILRLLENQPDMPEPQDLLSFDGAAWPIWQEDGLLAVSHGLYGGFSLVDITDIHDPVVLSHGTTPDTPMEAVRVGDRLFVADDGEAVFISGVRIFDIANPADPVYVGMLDMDAEALGLSVQDSLLLVRGENANYSRLQLFDVSDPLEPAVLGDYYTTYDYAEDAILMPGYLVSTSFLGLKVLRLPDLVEVDRGWGGIRPRGLVADNDGFYVVSSNFSGDGMLLRYTLDGAGQLKNHGGFGLLNLKNAQPAAGRLWGVYRNQQSIYELVGLPVHNPVPVPELELSFDRGHLRFTCSGATLPGEYVLYRERNGVREEIGRYATQDSSPVHVTLPVPTDLRVARFRLTIDVPVR